MRKEVSLAKNRHTGDERLIVRGSLPRTQTVSEISGARIHAVQSWSRPGSSRIPRLRGWANGALGNPTDSHCNPITRKAPQLLQGRTAGSPCRDKNNCIRGSISAHLSAGRRRTEETEENGKDKDWLKERTTGSGNGLRQEEVWIRCKD